MIRSDYGKLIVADAIADLVAIELLVRIGLGVC